MPSRMAPSPSPAWPPASSPTAHPCPLLPTELPKSLLIKSPWGTKGPTPAPTAAASPLTASSLPIPVVCHFWELTECRTVLPGQEHHPALGELPCCSESPPPTSALWTCISPKCVTPREPGTCPRLLTLATVQFPAHARPFTTKEPCSTHSRREVPLLPHLTREDREADWCRPEPRLAWSASPGPVPVCGAGTHGLSAPQRGFPAAGHNLLLSPGTDLCAINSMTDSNKTETRLALFTVRVPFVPGKTFSVFTRTCMLGQSVKRCIVKHKNSKLSP